MFKRKSNKENPLQDKLAGRIASCLLLVQTKFSALMNKRVGSMSRKKIVVMLFMFCLLSGGLSIYFLVDGLLARPVKSFEIEKVRIPKHFDRTGDEIRGGEMPTGIYHQFQEYRRFMDSSGEVIQPGMQDSMRVIEEMYREGQEINQ